MGNLLEAVADVFNHIEEYWNSIIGIFHGVNFTILYDWLPNDIVIVCTALIAAFVFFAFIGVLKKIILFFG